MTPPMMKFSFIFELLSAGIGLNMDGVAVISILLKLYINGGSVGIGFLPPFPEPTKF